MGTYRLSGGLSSCWEPSGWDLFLPLGIEADSTMAGDWDVSGRERGRSAMGRCCMGGREVEWEESLSREEFEKATAKGGSD